MKKFRSGNPNSGAHSLIPPASDSGDLQARSHLRRAPWRRSSPVAASRVHNLATVAFRQIPSRCHTFRGQPATTGDLRLPPPRRLLLPRERIPPATFSLSFFCHRRPPRVGKQPPFFSTKPSLALVLRQPRLEPASSLCDQATEASPPCGLVTAEKKGGHREFISPEIVPDRRKIRVTGIQGRCNSSCGISQHLGKNLTHLLMFV